MEARAYGHQAGEEAMATLLQRAPDIDAVFVGSDLLAAGALDTLRRLGRRVPEDVAVGGFDDSRIAATTDPPLTTVHQSFEQFGGRNGPSATAADPRSRAKNGSASDPPGHQGVGLNHRKRQRLSSRSARLAPWARR